MSILFEELGNFAILDVTLALHCGKTTDIRRPTTKPKACVSPFVDPTTGCKPGLSLRNGHNIAGKYPLRTRHTPKEWPSSATFTPRRSVVRSTS